MALTLILNGQSRVFETLAQSASLEQVIGELGLKGDRVAVEHNGEIVPRSGWAGTASCHIAPRTGKPWINTMAGAAFGPRSSTTRLQASGIGTFMRGSSRD